MCVAAYYLTFLVGLCSLLLVGYGAVNDFRNKTPPRSFDEWALSLGILIAGLALLITAMKAITS